MKKIFVSLAFVALVASACVPVRYGSQTEWYVMSQVGVTVRVVNNCAPFLDLERVGGVEVKGLPYGNSVTIPLVSTPFSGSNRRIPLAAKGYTDKREYLGSMTKTFSVSTHEGSREEVWEVDRLSLPGNRGGCR